MTDTSLPLDPSTVVSMHRMMRGLPDMAEKGVAAAAVRLRRLDVLQALHAAGELADKAVAGACVGQAILMNDAEILRWLVKRGAQPMVHKLPKPIAGHSGNPPKGSVLRDGVLKCLFASVHGGAAPEETWREGLRILLDGGAIGPNDYVEAAGGGVPEPLLLHALTSSAPGLALELIDYGAIPAARLLYDAFRTGNVEIAGCFAKATRAISIVQVRDLRHEMANREWFTKLPQTTRTKLRNLLDAVTAESLQLSDKDLEGRRGFMEAAHLISGINSDKAVRRLVERYAHIADDLLFFGARLGSAPMLQAALEFGGRLEPDAKTLKERATLNEKAQRNFSPYPIHNAGSAEALKVLIAAGADLSVKWGGEGVLHHCIRRVSDIPDRGDGAAEREAIQYFEALHAAGVDFSEGANGRSVMQIAAILKEPLRRTLNSIRTGDRISAAMKDDGQPDVPKAAQASAPGIL